MTKNCSTGPKSFRFFRETGPSPVSLDSGIAVPGSRLTGIRFFHVISFAGSSPGMPAESIAETDIKVHLMHNTAIANCWKKVIAIIRRIFVVPVLKTVTSRHNISSGSRRLAPSSRQNQARTRLPRFITSAHCLFSNREVRVCKLWD